MTSADDQMPDEHHPDDHLPDDQMPAGQHPDDRQRNVHHPDDQMPADEIRNSHLPDGLTLVRTTPTFDERSVPAGLLSAHRIADGVWGRLVVESGSLTFLFEDDRTGSGAVVAEGDAQVIPPARPHHLVVDGPVRFHVEFHR